jgi:hypothetical protein
MSIRRLFYSVKTVELRDTLSSIWTVLKTLLFAVVMISESILVSAVYKSPAASVSTSASVDSVVEEGITSSPHVELATTILRTLGHLSFVIVQFGGVSSAQGGFAELKKVFYLAHDILATDTVESEKLAYSLCADSQYYIIRATLSELTCIHRN